MADGSKYFRMTDDYEEDDEDALLVNYDLKIRRKCGIEHSPWNAECISRLLFLFIISMMAIGFMIRFMPAGHAVAVQFGHDHPHHHTFTKAAVAAGQLECSVVGKDVLEAGGNAVDAAIATTLCQGVVEPYFSGIGGGAGMTIYNATTKTVICITSRETAPAAATADMFLNATDNTGAKFIAIPGELKGLHYAYEKYGSGKLSWSELFEPAIRKAKLGFPISEEMEKQLQSLYTEYISVKPGLYRYFCELYCNHERTGVKKAGEIVKNVKLAETLTKVQKNGVKAFYQGDIAEQIIKDIRDAGGIMTMDDLKSYTVEEHPALVIPLPNAGYTIHAPPLPYGGPVFGAIMTIMDLYNVTPSVYDTNETLQWHRVDEAFRHAYGVRYSMGDLKFQPQSKEIVDEIVSLKFAIEAKKKIFDTKTFHDPKYYGARFSKHTTSSTSHVSVLGPNKDAVSITSTVNYHFGSKVISPTTGIVFNNEMDDFSYPTGDPIHDSELSPANQIEGGKHPLSSMSPVVITDNAENDPVFIIGAAGGKMIPTAIANVMLRLLYFTNDDFDDPIRARRIHDSLIPDIMGYEKGFDENIVAGLKRLGHNVTVMKEGSHVNGIKFHKSHIHAFSDLRNKGAGVSGW